MIACVLGLHDLSDQIVKFFWRRFELSQGDERILSGLPGLTSEHIIPINQINLQNAGGVFFIAN